ncbi:PLP-dependent aminotransferase family protein [Oharaeibacter diazotrophicus]|uniref:DNA-binding transcriptional MocR family regulator n=1 Tax=Oharaeibacter diazotrophicus TaxID=1920512 RepID=A0A4R6RFA3_9HYPH|nr:PLP-dependent aminotransferase family protein [Oharaeibacter diazotrophicus]TDP84973.1 DNA-binding transcriptional MocR family regulator [Oharaeibacter diazotrophicus]BBE73942.1 putative HTH-type transcriptional regulator YdcR [Pleomorphomonas sp. SM30]GLS76371.1 transcriptional regulator [Oharaeibacter diazotrophicus]
MDLGVGPRTAEAMAAIRARISGGGLGPGDRLPSIRRLAATLGLSPSTVVEAYDRLAAEGVIRARPGSGFYVVPGVRPPLAFAPAVGRPPAVDPFWVSRLALDADPAMAKPGCGWLPADWMPTEALRRAIRTVARSDAALLTDYGGTRGSPALRRLLANRLADEGVPVGPDRILLTASGTQAIDLVCRMLLRPGDTVILDDPCYFNFQALLGVHGVRTVGVPFGETGPDVAAFEATVAAERPRLYLTNAALHNPTGATMAPQTAHRVLAAAAAHDVVVVEDDIFADFEPDRSVRLAALDGLDRVVRVGSFSKTLSASVRCGYVAARADWIEALVDLQVATGFGGPSPVAAEVVARLLAEGGYRRHVEGLRRRLDGARRDAARQLGDLGMEPWTMPRGGFYLWCRLPDGRDGATVARAALGEGVVLAPGDVFAVSGSAAAFMRFNVAWARDARALDVLRRALDGPAEEGAAPDG